MNGRFKPVFHAGSLQKTLVPYHPGVRGILIKAEEGD